MANWIEWIGYLASALVALSLIVTKAVKFRIFNLLGCITFITYGVFISAFPVILANSILLVINIFQLIKLYKIEEQFQLIPFNIDDKIVEKFLQFYTKDIQNYFPAFQLKQTNLKQLNYVVMRDISIANIFVVTIDNTGNAMVQINYTVPQYRDYKATKFIIEKEKKTLINNGVKTIVYEKVENKTYLQFLQIVGFTQEIINNNKCWVKHLV